MHRNIWSSSFRGIWMKGKIIRTPCLYRWKKISQFPFFFLLLVFADSIIVMDFPVKKERKSSPFLLLIYSISPANWSQLKVKATLETKSLPHSFWQHRALLIKSLFANGGQGICTHKFPGQFCFRGALAFIYLRYILCPLSPVAVAGGVSKLVRYFAQSIPSK